MMEKLIILFVVFIMAIMIGIIILYIKAIKKKVEYNKKKMQHYDDVNAIRKHLDNERK